MAKVKTTDETLRHEINTASLVSRCRVCLQIGAIPIFGDESRLDISADVASCGSIQIDPDDQLPQWLCITCHRYLKTAILFRTSALHSDFILRRQKSKLQSKPKISTISKNVKAIEDKYQECESSKRVSNVKLELSKDEFHESNDEFNNVGNIEIEILIVKDEIEDTPSYISSKCYPCSLCTKKFQSLGEYDLHILSEEHKNNAGLSKQPKQRVFRKECQECKLKFKSADVYWKHMKSVHGRDRPVRNRIECNLCKQPIPRNQYAKHTREVHKTEPDLSLLTNFKTRKECEVCKKSVSSLYYKRHLQIAHDSKIRPKNKEKKQCPYCNKFYGLEYIATHVKKHKLEQKGIDPARFVCDQCGKKFCWLGTFNNHRLTHSNNFQFHCDFCPYQGRTKDLLRIHVRTHTGNYPYKCTECSAQYTTKSNLTKHMQRHRGAVDFICDTCKRGCYSKLELERHIEVNHMGIKKHSCNICGTAFGYRQGLMAHERKVHKREKRIPGRQPIYLKIAGKS